MTKSKVVICLDGTGNEPEDAVQDVEKDGGIEDDSISNVLKLHLHLGGKLNNSQTDPEQKSYYYSGVGTRGTFLRQALASAFANFEPGWIRDDAYDDLCDNYNNGDEIFILGFSRGAAIARMLASKISKEGINGQRAKIKFLGVWDTVASMGALNLDDETQPISDVLFENNTVAAAIENAVHLVSIDETRLAFRPTLMNVENKVEEVWFAGVHSDIGGGYRLSGLSDLTLDFMMKRAAQHGLLFLQSNDIDLNDLRGKKGEIIDRDDIFIAPDIAGSLHRHIP